MIGTIKSAISSYTGIGQTKKNEESNAPQQQSSEVKSNASVSSSSGEVRGESFAGSTGDTKLSSNPSGSRAFLGVQSNFSTKITGATAEKEKPPMDRNKTVDIVGDSPEARERRVDLLRSTPQINKTSGPDGENRCGGASLASALILDSGKSADAAKKNAQSIRDVYGGLYKDKDGNPKKLSQDQETALKNLEAGKLSPKDVEQLQNITYDITQKVHGQGSGGVNIDGMAEAVNMLRSKGGFAGGSDVKFHLNEGESSRAGGKHWTTTVDGVHVDTWPTNKIGGKAVVTGFPGAGEPPGIGKGSKGWNGEISFTGDSNARMEYMPSENGKPMSVEFDKKNYDGKSTEEILSNNITGKDIEAMQRRESTMQQWMAMEKGDPSGFQEWKEKDPATYNRYEEWKKNNS